MVLQGNQVILTAEDTENTEIMCSIVFYTLDFLGIRFTSDIKETYLLDALFLGDFGNEALFRNGANH